MLCLLLTPVLWPSLTEGAHDAPFEFGVADRSASAEALLVRGIAHAGSSSLLLGAAELELAVERRPGWRPAHEALGAALLRIGRFSEAAEQFSTALGRSLADSLGRGLTPSDGSLSAGDENALYGLAVSQQMAGHAREAERLYRAYADLVGTTSAESARAYYRLHELFDYSGHLWGDQAAELAKALAVDPGIESRLLLPSFPDPAELPGTEPYLVPIELAGEPRDSVSYDALPMLSRWSAPDDSSSISAELGAGALPVEIEVGEDGVPEEVRVLAQIAEPDSTSIVDAVDRWRFWPAIVGGRAAAARIIYGRQQVPEQHSE